MPTKAGIQVRSRSKFKNRLVPTGVYPEYTAGPERNRGVVRLHTKIEKKFFVLSRAVYLMKDDEQLDPMIRPALDRLRPLHNELFARGSNR